jgi:hypothetical protein
MRDEKIDLEMPSAREAKTKKDQKHSKKKSWEFYSQIFPTTQKWKNGNKIKCICHDNVRSDRMVWLLCA